MNPITLIKNLFKIAKLVSVDDSGDYQFASITTLGKTQKVMLLKPYGLISSPPADAIVALFSQQGQESNGIGIADDPKNRTIKDLASGSGEVGLANHTTGNFVFLDSGGSTQLVSAKDLIATITRNVTATIGGDVTATVIGNIIANAVTMELNGDGDNLTMWAALNTQLQLFMTEYNDHKHRALGALALTTSTNPASTLNITSARADTLKTDG